MFKFSAFSQIWKEYIQKLNTWDLSLNYFTKQLYKDTVASFTSLYISSFVLRLPDYLGVLFMWQIVHFMTLFIIGSGLCLSSFIWCLWYQRWFTSFFWPLLLMLRVDELRWRWLDIRFFCCINGRLSWFDIYLNLIIWKITVYISDLIIFNMNCSNFRNLPKHAYFSGIVKLFYFIFKGFSWKLYIRFLFWKQKRQKW